jgi:hypothetical protein
MKPKLKEDPKEWRKFVWAGCAVLLVISGLAYRRQRIALRPFEWITGFSLGLALIGAVAPRLFRGLYRMAMTISFHVGQVMQRVLLGFVYFLVVLPLALFLRATGKDLLALRKGSASSFWKPARKSGSFDQQF